MTWTQNDFCIDTDISKLDLNYIHAFLGQQAYWSENIPFEIVRRSVDGSICFGVFHREQQVGFARLITDRATFAYLADVFIDPAYRGRGLSKWLMSVILSHPDVQEVRNIMLGTRDAHGLYQQFGFKNLENPERYMRLHFPNRYKKEQPAE